MSVAGVQVVRLDPGRPVRVEIGARAEAGEDARVEAEWERKRGINPRLFDGPVLSVREIDAGRGMIRCEVESYKRLVVQPEVATGVELLSVTGVLTATDSAGRKRVLLGRRSHKTRMYGGMWQNCPAGGVDPVAGVTCIDEGGLIAELLREVREESGLEPVEGVGGKPVAVIFDETARSHDLIVPVDMGAVGNLATVRGWEYDELKWLDVGCVREFEEEEAGRIMAITRAVFGVMGWR